MTSRFVTSAKSCCANSGNPTDFGHRLPGHSAGTGRGLRARLRRFGTDAQSARLAHTDKRLFARTCLLSGTHKRACENCRTPRGARGARVSPLLRNEHRRLSKDASTRLRGATTFASPRQYQRGRVRVWLQQSFASLPRFQTPLRNYAVAVSGGAKQIITSSTASGRRRYGTYQSGPLSTVAPGNSQS